MKVMKATLPTNSSIQSLIWSITLSKVSLLLLTFKLVAMETEDPWYNKWELWQRKEASLTSWLPLITLWTIPIRLDLALSKWALLPNKISGRPIRDKMGSSLKDLSQCPNNWVNRGNSCNRKCKRATWPITD